MPVEVMLIAICGMGTYLAMIYIIGKAETEKARAKAAGEVDAGAIQKLLADNASEVSRLRARVEVLERLATDEDRKLAGDIARLRTEPRAMP